MTTADPHNYRRDPVSKHIRKQCDRYQRKVRQCDRNCSRHRKRFEGVGKLEQILDFSDGPPEYERATVFVIYIRRRYQHWERKWCKLLNKWSEFVRKNT